MPRSGESLNQFQADDLACRNCVQTRTAPPGAIQAAANNSAVGSAAVGTATGASAGALLGAAAGNAGVGAAIGAGAGLLTGAAVGANNAGAIAGGAQAQYDAAYAQCMTSKGNIIVTAPPGYGYAYPGGYPFTPTPTRAPIRTAIPMAMAIRTTARTHTSSARGRSFLRAALS
jgi:hypothetical protein